MNLSYISQELNSQQKCVKYLESMRWKSTPTCPYCGSQKTSSKKLRHNCHSCKNSFSVTVGTVFENSKLPLQKWLMAITLILSARKGISSMQLSRDLKVNKNTAWLLQMKIRSAMSTGELDVFKEQDNEPKLTPWGTFLERRKQRGRANFITARNLKNFGIYGVEGLFRRAIIGQYHKIDEFYLENYLDEVRFKFDRNTEVDLGYQELMGRLVSV